MSRTDTLKSLEIVLESFLDRAVQLKESRLGILNGINRLDDIARLCQNGDSFDSPDLSDQMGAWLADHTSWLNDDKLRPGDRSRVEQILANVRESFRTDQEKSPAEEKIAAEIGRWQSQLTPKLRPSTATRKSTRNKIVLRKGPESLDEAGVHPSSEDSIGLFAASLNTISGIFQDLSPNRQHLMSILDDTLKSAALQKSREALLLSALIIYYLKQNGYMVEPFVVRLKEAERLQQENSNA